MSLNGTNEPQEQADVPMQGRALSWYVTAWRERGAKPYNGLSQNPNVVGYLRSLTNKGTHDPITWQSAFVNHCLTVHGYLGTNDARSGSWATWGQKIATPIPGCIVVISMMLGTVVGFYTREDEHSVWLLGANHDEMVNIRSQPKSRVVSYRMPLLLTQADNDHYQKMRAS